jgi:hypothetical protein
LTNDDPGERKEKKEERRSLIYPSAEHIFMWFILPSETKKYQLNTTAN